MCSVKERLHQKMLDRCLDGEENSHWNIERKV